MQYNKSAIQLHFFYPLDKWNICWKRKGTCSGNSLVVAVQFLVVTGKWLNALNMYLCRFAYNVKVFTCILVKSLD